MALTGPSSGWMRNYEQMADDNVKLLRCLRELKAGSGDAVNRVYGSNGMMYEHIRECEAVAASRGLVEATVDPNADAAAMGVLTEAMECPDCGRVERFYEDDYKCRTCRDGMSAA